MSDHSPATTPDTVPETPNAPDDSPETAAKDAAKEARKKRRWKIISCFSSLVSVIFVCGWETFLLKNIPMLIATLLFLCGFALLRKVCTKKFQKNWAQIVALIIGAWVYVALFIGAMNLLPVTVISEKTTYLTEPRTADGKSLDLPRAVAERFLPDCPPEQNGFRQVIETFGFSQVIGMPEQLRDAAHDRLFAELNIDEKPDWDAAPRVRFESAYDFFEKHFEQILQIEESGDDALEPEVKDCRTLVYEAVGKLHQLPWPEEHRETATRWLAENNAAFDALGEAVRMPEYFVPFFLPDGSHIMFEGWGGYDGWHREMAHGLRLRVISRLEQGDLDGAKYDLLTINRLAEKMMRHPHSTSGLLVASAVKSIAHTTTLDVLQYGKLNHEQLAALQRELAESHYLYPQSDVVFLMRMEGMHSLYYVGSGEMYLTDSNLSAALSDYSPTFEDYLAKYLSGNIRYVGWTGAFQQFNEKVNELESIAEMPLSPEQIKRFNAPENFETNLWASGEDPNFLEMLGYFFQKGTIPGVSHAIGAIMADLSLSSYNVHGVYRHESLARLLDIAFALEHYALDHDGAYPESLDALIGKGIDELPTDPCTDGEAFRYRLQEVNDQAGYVLYGVGLNMQDDDGNYGQKTDPETDTRIPGDDCVIEMPQWVDCSC